MIQDTDEHPDRRRRKKKKKKKSIGLGMWEGAQSIYALSKHHFRSTSMCSPTCKLSESILLGFLWRLYDLGMIHH